MKNKFLRKVKTEYIGRSYAVLCGVIIIVLTLSIIAYIASSGLNLFIKHRYPLSKFLFSAKWNPDATNPQFGALIFIAGSTLVSLGAILLSTPISIALAIFMNYISPEPGRRVLQPALELFVGIPSVVYGWIGISLFVPLIRMQSKGIGFSLLAGIIILSIMTLPTIASISSDAIKTVSKDYAEASYGLGATRWQTISKVIVPAAKTGILTAVVLGLARAFGEALAVQMVIGNSIRMPEGLFNPTSTLTGILAADMGNTGFGTAWNDALWSLALLLLIISLLFIIIIRIIGKRGEVK